MFLFLSCVVGNYLLYMKLVSFPGECVRTCSCLSFAIKMKEEEEEEEKECVEAINLFDVYIYIYSSLKHCSFFSFSSLVVIILQ